MGKVRGEKREREDGREGIWGLSACSCLWVYGQDLLFSISFCFPSSFLPSTIPLSLSLSLSLSPPSPLQYRAGMDNPVIALRFGLLLEMYCRGSPNHMSELQQQVQWAIV